MQRARRWLQSGHGVGLHTATHPFCSTLSGTQAMLEIATAADMLRESLAISDIALAYPFGDPLPAHIEQTLLQSARLTCCLGVGGLSQRGTSIETLQRATGEIGINDGVFGRAALRAILGR
jgi:peptidoglycan/xylan/chitin deacetylase (PgdA/CDA1 family)